MGIVLLCSFFDPISSFKNCDSGFSFNEKPKKLYQTRPNVGEKKLGSSLVVEKEEEEEKLSTMVEKEKGVGGIKTDFF